MMSQGQSITLTMQGSQKTLKNDQQSLDEMKISLSIKR